MIQPTVWHEIPEGYKVIAFCRSCGKDFAGDYYFDMHRTGTHDYTHSQGLQFDPPVEDGRRCKTTEELLESGMRPLTEQEMKSSKRHSHRVGFGVEMWFDPSRSERLKSLFSNNEEIPVEPE